jgi:hypothetical protein
LDQKIYRNKKFLEFNFKEGIFYAKNPKSKIFKRPPIDGVASDQKVA